MGLWSGLSASQSSSSTSNWETHWWFCAQEHCHNETGKLEAQYCLRAFLNLLCSALFRLVESDSDLFSPFGTICLGQSEHSNQDLSRKCSWSGKIQILERLW